MPNSPDGGCMGPPRLISGVSTGGGLIKLNGPDGVIIDGSCGGSPPALTITNGNANAAVIWIASASASDGANNVTVENCIISGSPGGTAVAGIVSGSGTTLGGDAEAPNNNITIQNNSIFRVQNSCYLRGTDGRGRIRDGLLPATPSVLPWRLIRISSVVCWSRIAKVS